MYFEAELKGKKYKIDVTELRHSWKVSLQEETKQWIHYDISKNDYKDAEQYISFLFNGSSFLIDVIGKDTEYTVFTRNSFRTIKIYNDEMILHESLPVWPIVRVPSRDRMQDVWRSENCDAGDPARK